MNINDANTILSKQHITYIIHDLCRRRTSLPKPPVPRPVQNVRVPIPVARMQSILGVLSPPRRHVVIRLQRLFHIVITRIGVRVLPEDGREVFRADGIVVGFHVMDGGRDDGVVECDSMTPLLLLLLSLRYGPDFGGRPERKGSHARKVKERRRRSMHARGC